ncbi:unnamed protein product, partial [Ectocarpus fasciculatus]
IFSELDTLDEAETLLLARFMNLLMEHDEFSGDVDFDNEASKGEKLTTEDNSPDWMHVDSISFVMDSQTNLEDNDIFDFTLPSGPLTAEWVPKIANVYKQGGKLSRRSIHSIMKAAYKSFTKVSNISSVTFGAEEKLTVVGDIHGQLEDLLYILDDSGWPSQTNKYIFNGDFVDRGKKGVEVVTLLFALYVAFPGCVFLNRGNHEDKAICAVYGFQKECTDKYDSVTYTMFCEIFNNLPLCAVVNDSIFVVHGGLFHETDVTLDDINNITRTDYKAEKANPDTERNRNDPTGFYLRTLQQCALWSDPHKFDVVVPNNKRGAGMLFGVSMTNAFLGKNKLKLIVRSHECAQDGIDWPFRGTSVGNKLCTLFSASDYSASGNKAAYMVFYNHNVPGADQVEMSNMYFSTHVFSTSANNSYSDLAQQESVHLLHDLIVKKRNALKSNFAAADVAGSGFITKSKWAEIMLEVTKVSILWIPMIPIIVPPDALKGVELDYETFLLKYQVGTTEKDANINELYAQREKLERIFKFFDTDGGGTISREEFRVGCEAINRTLPAEKNIGNADAILDLMDFDGNDEIDLNEFFEVWNKLFI